MKSEICFFGYGVKFFDFINYCSFDDLIILEENIIIIDWKDKDFYFVVYKYGCDELNIDLGIFDIFIEYIFE